jgi:hypothetical protein
MPWMTLFYFNVKLLGDFVEGTGWRVLERIDVNGNACHAVLGRT